MDTKSQPARSAVGDAQPVTKEQAQRRVDQIGAFTRETGALEQAGILALAADQRERIRAHHAEILDRFARKFDVDRSEAQKSVSLGMRITSFIGAVALSAAVFLFFYRFWGALSTVAQVAILAGVPIAALVGVDLIARRDETRYFTGLMAVVAFACFILDVTVVDGIFNRVFSPWEILAWSALALLLAYHYSLQLLLAAGGLLLMGFLAAIVASSSGIFWGAFASRPETLMVASLVALGVAAAHPAPRLAAFASTWRVLGAIGLLFPMVALAVRGEMSFLTALGLRAGAVQVAYDILGFALGAGALWVGIRRQWREVVNAAAAFIAVFLFAKIIDWYWAWMPRYLFFLVIGLVAVALLVALRQVRARFRQV